MIQYSKSRNTLEERIVLTFIIRGATHVLSEPKFSETILLETLSKIVTLIISMDGVQTSSE